MTGYLGGAPLLLALLLSGCAQVGGMRVVTEPAAFEANQPVEKFSLEARLSVKTEAQGFSGSLAWTRAPAEEVMLFSTPLGQGVAEISRQGTAVVLKDSEGKSHVAESGEALLARVLGIRLPLAGMVYWLSALPRPGEAFRAELDEAGRVASLEQDGWRIDYSRYEQRQGRWLPGRLFARRGEDLEFRLMLDHWEAR